MAPQPALPTEVFEEIIGQASDNTESLRCLSLTCNAFLPRARYHLFISMQIRTVEQLDSSGEFLDSHPWLTPLVRRVALRLLTNSVLDVVPVHLFSRLPNLCSWSIGSPGSWSNRLSLHRLTLSCYQRYSVNIQHLEVSNVTLVDNISDFLRLVSAFAAIQSLACSHIEVRSMKGHGSSLDGTGTNITRAAQTLRIKTLHIGDDVDIRIVEYLLTASASMVNSLSLTIDPSSSAEDENYIHRLQNLASSLVQLFSLTLTVDHFGSPRDASLESILSNATQILQHIDRARLNNVRVEFRQSGFITSLGRFLYKDGPGLEKCRVLEEELLAFEVPACILVYQPLYSARAGRLRFWRPTIERAFPRLSQRGLLTIMRAHESATAPVGHEESVTSLVASHDSKRIVTASKDGTIILWDTERGTIVHEWVAHHGDEVNDLALSPDSQRLVSSGSREAEAPIVWDISNGTHRVAALEGHTAAVTTCAWSPDGALIASASRDQTTRVWDGHTFEQRALLEDTKAVSGPQSLQFSPDASYLAWRCGHSAGGCTIWKPLEGEQSKTLDLSDRGIGINAISFGPESRRFATAHGSYLQSGEREHHAIRVWDVATAAELAVLAGHSESRHVYDVSFAPDGRFLLSASQDGSTRIWETDSWRATGSLELEGTKKPPTLAACFSSNGRYIATGSEKGTVRLWRLARGDAESSLVMKFSEHARRVRHVAFSPDGEFLASGDYGGIVHIRRLSDFVGR